MNSDDLQTALLPDNPMSSLSQVLCLLNHCDSPYIRGLGFMFLRFTLPPAMMFDWFEGYLDDEEVCSIVFDVSVIRDTSRRLCHCQLL